MMKSADDKKRNVEGMETLKLRAVGGHMFLL
jgi:hypothetical protein